jgi:phage tail sheath protein FI
LESAQHVERQLLRGQRDELYESNVNPIVTFPGQGVCVFGQKTLQKKASALDRVNVRRLLITLKKFFASTSRFLVFEQNNAKTRSRFLNIVNPYMEQVQSNSGVNVFKVVMDETNNTPDQIDRNQLVGQVIIQPTRTAEFIVLDFTVQRTGAAFPE